jgi:hypothetical protein
MKSIKYTLMIPMVAFLMGASSSLFGATGILRALNRIPGFLSAHSEINGRDNPARVLPPAASTTSLAPAVAADRVTRSSDKLFGGNVEEFAAEPDGETSQGSGYGDVFDSDGHLLWRFAALERNDSQWTILRYFSERESARKNFVAAREPVTDRNNNSSLPR